MDVPTEAGSRTQRRWISGIEPAPELLTANGTQILEFECREQPKKLAELIEAYAGDPEVRLMLSEARAGIERPGPVLFLGMGASWCSSISGSILLQSHGKQSFSVDAGEWIHYGISSWKQAAYSVILTTSGESAEIVKLFRAEEAGPAMLICNNPASTCWQLASTKVPILAGPEYGNATKSYTNATAASIIAASEMLGLDWQRDAKDVCVQLESDLERVFAMRSELEAFCRGAANIEIVGRGGAYGGAVMSALCIREMSGFRAAAHTGAGFRHGPNLDVDGTHVAIIFALGRAAELGVKLAAECNRRGGKVVLVSTEERGGNDRLLPIRIGAVAEPWEGISSLIVPQALTLAMVERNGCRLPPRFEYGVMEQ